NVHVVTTSHWLGGEAKRSALLKNKNVSVIPNPLDVDLYKPSDQLQARRILGIDENDKVILFMAANASSIYKGVKYLEDSLRMMASKYPELAASVTLLIIGRVKENIYADFPVKTKLTGTINDEATLIRHYQSSDLFVLPSL